MKYHQFLKYGAPFVVFTIGSWLALTQFVSSKYEAQDKAVVKQSERQAQLESERQAIMAKFSADYELKPIPLPPSER